jgi:hypothetical protein
MVSPESIRFMPFPLLHCSQALQYSTSSRAREMKDTVFARFQLLPTKEAWPERIHFRLQDAIEVELAKMNFVVIIKA